MAKSNRMPAKGTYPRRGAEKVDVVNNSYKPIDQMPMVLGQAGPVYYIPSDKRDSTGYIPLAYRDNNQR